MITRKQVKAKRRANKLVSTLEASQVSDASGSTGSTPVNPGGSSGGGPLPIQSLVDRLKSCHIPGTYGTSYTSVMLTPRTSAWKCETWDWTKKPSLKKPTTSMGGVMEPTTSAAAPRRGGTCVVCKVPSTASCSACGKVFYCGKVHQRKHWSEHKMNCYPFEEMSLEELNGQKGPMGSGPYIKASKDLKPYDKIFEECPLMTGPGCCADLEFEPVCLGCTECILASQKCSKCGWPLCGPQCEKDTRHAEYECEIFMKNGVLELHHAFQYELVRVLRCLMTQKKAPDVFEQLMKLDGALKHRKRIKSLIEATKTACMFIRENCKLTEFDESIINHMCGVVDLQTIPSGKNRSSMQIFSFPSKLLHACNANTRILEILKPNGEHLLKVVAIREIKRGEPLTHRLVTIVEPTYERQRFLQDNYYFQCKCEICMDPTEKGTYFSAVICPACLEATDSAPESEEGKQNHYIVPVSPTNIDSKWACDHCKSEFESNRILQILDGMDCQSDYFNKTLSDMDSIEEHILALREKITDLERELHPNNYHIWKLTRSLFETLYLYILVMPPPSTWTNFIEIYKEVDDLANQVVGTLQLHQPGRSINRGRELYGLIVSYWGYIQWAVMFGKACNFQSHPGAPLFYDLVEETIAIFEPETTERRKIIDSITYMRDNVEEVRSRVELLGRRRITGKPSDVSNNSKNAEKTTK